MLPRLPALSERCRNHHIIATADLALSYPYPGLGFKDCGGGCNRGGKEDRNELIVFCDIHLILLVETAVVTFVGAGSWVDMKHDKSFLLDSG